MTSIMRAAEWKQMTHFRLRERHSRTTNHIKLYMETCRKRQRRPEMKDVRRGSEVKTQRLTKTQKAAHAHVSMETTAHHGQTRQSQSITCSHQPAVGILSQLKTSQRRGSDEVCFD